MNYSEAGRLGGIKSGELQRKLKQKRIEELEKRNSREKQKTGKNSGAHCGI